MQDEQARYVTSCAAIVGIDPGPTESALAIVRADRTIVEAWKLPNAEFLDRYNDTLLSPKIDAVVIEGIQCYGMAVGRQVFETAYMVGEVRGMCRLHDVGWSIVPRQEYARAICGTAKVSDAILRQALLLRFGGDKKGEPLHALKGSSDLRSAYALAVYAWDLVELEGRRR